MKKLPFWGADALLLVAAGTLVALGGRPLGLGEMVAVVVCVALGAWFGVLPYLREYAAELQLTETARLDRTAARLSQLEGISERIAGATSQWQVVQDHARRTVEASQGVVDRISREAESLASTVSRTAESEKQTLKLEVEKLRRGEGEWLQAVGRVMDHVFALHAAAVRSGQTSVVQQLDRFHGACREALRRVGFVTVVATPDELFDPRRHQVADGPRPEEGVRVDETVAPGFQYQGQLLRPVIVRVLEPGGRAADAEAPPPEETLGQEDAEEGDEAAPEEAPADVAMAGEEAAGGGATPEGAAMTDAPDQEEDDRATLGAS
ncbi:MAG: hypothetical protein KF833_16090 [Verrucomicrobiae bacterium]|nr:hypothetical protein [Verrucomicrobiae bacterium]